MFASLKIWSLKTRSLKTRSLKTWQGLAVGLGLLLSAHHLPATAAPTLLFDAADGRVLYAEDADLPWFAASLTKMMTAYVLFEDVAAGKTTLQSKITISNYANGQPKMNLALGTGKEITVDDAIEALVMKSANDIAVAIAEHVSGSEEAFVERMNDTARRLGMYGTRFVNPNGLPGEGQETTARDLALLARALERDFPQFKPVFAMKEAAIGKLKIATHNPVLRLVKGGNGVKTGFTCSAGYNIVASAERNGRRLVAVVLGAPDKTYRALRTRNLFEFGFARLDWKALAPAPTVAGLPETAFDRAAVRAVNLDTRYMKCRDPVPTLTLAMADMASVAADPSVVADAAIRAAATAAIPAEAEPPAKLAKAHLKTRHKSTRLTTRQLRAKLNRKTAAKD